MPEYSSTTITPADGVQLPAQNGGTSGNFQLSALKSFILASKGQANGLAGLGSDGKLDPSQVPGNLDDVLVYATRSNFPAAGTAGKIYIAADTNIIYRWDPDLSVPAYVELSVDLSDYATKAELAEEESAREEDISDVKNAITANTARIENLEQEHGGYTVVNYRGTNAVPTGKAKYALVESIVGKSRAWNQLVVNGNFAENNGWIGVNCTLNIDTTNKEITITATNATCEVYYNGNMNLVVGHKCLVVASIISKTSSNGEMKVRNPYNGTHTTIPTGVFADINISADKQIDLAFRSMTVGDTVKLKYVICRDMNLIFPEGVPSTVAECVALCPDILKYDAYGQSIVDTTVEGVKSLRQNLITTTKVTVSSASMASNEFAVSAGQSIYVSGKATRITGATITQANIFFCRVNWYNGSTLLSTTNGTIQYSFSSGTISYGEAFTAPSSTTKAIVDWSNYNGDGNYNTIKSDLFVEIGTEHFESTLSLPTPITLRSAGSGVNEVHDTLDVETGVPTIRVKEIDISTLQFGYYTGTWAGSYFGAVITDAIFDGASVVASATCSQYMAIARSQMGNYTDMVFCFDTNGQTLLQIKNASKGSGDLDGSGHASWLEGVKLTYKIAESTGTSIGASNNMIQTEGGGTINTIQTQTPVIDNCMDVGYLAL